MTHKGEPEDTSWCEGLYLRHPAAIKTSVNSEETAEYNYSYFLSEQLRLISYAMSITSQIILELYCLFRFS